MAPPNLPWVPVGEFEVTPLVETERGEFFHQVRWAGALLASSVWGPTPRAAFEAAIACMRELTLLRTRASKRRRTGRAAHAARA